MESVKDTAIGVSVGGRILEAFREPLALEAAQVNITTSVGVSFSTPETTRSGLLRMADSALYFSKRAGKNRCTLFSAEMMESTRNFGAQLS